MATRWYPAEEIVTVLGQGALADTLLDGGHLI
jgi:hypothetical protein